MIKIQKYAWKIVIKLKQLSKIIINNNVTNDNVIYCLRLTKKENSAEDTMISNVIKIHTRK